MNTGDVQTPDNPLQNSVVTTEGVVPSLPRGKEGTGDFRNHEWSDKPDTDFVLNSGIMTGA
ncbi:hypothetical protein D1X02_24475 [Salmonella enterica]|nr:hypothetical protein [Salmonella enterica]